jgi:hypothetical protein
MMAFFLLVFGLNGFCSWTKWLPVVCIFLYRLGFICSEICEDLSRAQASSVVGVSNWIVRCYDNFSVTGDSG